MSASPTAAAALAESEPSAATATAALASGDAPARSDESVQATRRAGLIYAIGAYGFWAIVPFYFKQFDKSWAFEVLCHRVVWSLALLALLIHFSRRWPAVRAALTNRKTLMTLSASAVLIAANWTGYIYAVASGQTLQGSLGYYINPLLSVLLGVLVLRERLRRAQVIGVVLAAIGVSYLTLSYGQFPWLALGLAGSFGFYGLLRKTVNADSLTGLAVETALLSPLALFFMVSWSAAGEGAFLHVSRWADAMFLLAGVITSVPLLWFTSASRRLPLATLGMLQYISPTGQLLIAVFAFGEVFTRAHAVCFACVWSALALIAWDGYARSRKANA